jgi:hypothetical protein
MCRGFQEGIGSLAAAAGSETIDCASESEQALNLKFTSLRPTRNSKPETTDDVKNSNNPNKKRIWRRDSGFVFVI